VIEAKNSILFRIGENKLGLWKSLYLNTKTNQHNFEYYTGKAKIVTKKGN